MAIAAAAAAIAAWPAGSARAAAPETWYAETVSESDKGFLVTHFWSKGPRMRSETVIRGHRIITIVNGERYVIVDALSQSGVSIRRSPAAIAADATRGRPFANEFRELVARGGERVGEQVVSGRATDVYRVTDGMGKTTVWMAREEPRFPVRAEHYSRRTTQTAVTTYVNWLTQIPIPDAFFEPGPGIEIEYVEYDDYRKRVRKELVGPAPVLYAPLLHGSRE